MMQRKHGTILLFNRNAPTNLRASVGIDVAHFTAAYSAAVGVSALVFGVQIGIVTWMAGGASSVPMPDRLFQSALMSLLIALGFAFFALWLAFVPALVSVALARRLGVESMSYYVACGFLSAIMLTPIVWLLAYDDIADFPLTFDERFIRATCLLIVPAIIGAITFWFVDRRLRVKSLASGDEIR